MSVRLYVLLLVPVVALLALAFRRQRELGSALPLALLAGGWGISGWLLVLGHEAQRHDREATFAALVSEAHAGVERRLVTYIDALRSGASFMVASTEVTRAEWNTFAGTLNLQGRYPGINGIGVILPVQRDDVAAFEQETRASGAPGFTVHDVPGAPASTQPERAVITYIAPLAGNDAALGLDVSSEPIRQRAAIDARDTGEPRMTRRITLVQGTGQNGFLLYVPVYRPDLPLETVAQRRTAFRAWVYAPFFTERFLNGVLGARETRVHVLLFEGESIDEANLLYATSDTVEEDTFHQVTALTMAGQRFTLGWYPGQGLPPTPLSPLTWVGLGGAMTTVWLVSLAVSERRLKSRVQALVAERTSVLRQSELRYRELVERLPEPTYVVRDQRFVYLNPAAVTLLGAADRTALTGADAMARVHPEFRGVAADRWRAVLSGTSVPVVEGRLVRMDGSVVEVEFQCGLIEYDGIPAVQVVLRDLTARRHAEAALELRSVALDAAANAILITDRNGVIEWTNRAFSTVTGYSPEEAVGRTPGDLLRSGRHDRGFYERLWQTILNGHVWRGEIINTRKDGTQYPSELTITPVRARGDIRHFIAVEEDITQRRRLEEQFRQAQKMESIGRLAGGVAHDFNNMLGVIIGVADLALSSLDAGHPLRSDLQEILDAARRSAELTRQLLTFARKQSVDPVVVDLNVTVPSSIRMLQRLIGEHIRLEWLPGPALWPVYIDLSQLDQILANLSVNARDAIDNAGVITLATENCTVDERLASQHVDAVPGDFVRLTVRDSGRGMSPEVAAHIFEPFFTTKGIGEGTGLGLSTVYGAVRQSGGFILVSTGPGIGTTFEIHLPRHQQASVALPAASDPAAGAGHETILIVEDESLVLRMTARALEARGYVVLAANGPAAALAMAATHTGTIDLLLSDVVMPGMSGRDLGEEFRVRYPHIRQMFMSGFPANALGTGTTAMPGPILTKPFSVATLCDAVRRTLDGRADR